MSPFFIPQSFVFLFRCKFRWKSPVALVIPVFLCALASLAVPVSTGAVSAPFKCNDIKCYNGDCLNGTCVCHDGWRGPSCQWCTGKVKLSGTSGFIHDGVGNYSIDVKCSWLIDGSALPNASIRLHIEEFATECGWDHLYIYDGDSVHSPLLAVYSGLMYKKDEYRIRRVPEVVASSGYALIHFYSDVAYNMSGFNISYKLNSCPSNDSAVNCSGHGICIDGICTCDAFWTGEACDTHICPNNCSWSNGACRPNQHKCECFAKYVGDDCSQVSDFGYWETVRPRGSLPKGSASHTAVVWRDSLHIIGGESYNTADMIYTYDFTGNVWETYHMDSRTAPTPRYGHSAVIFGDKIYIYGGVKTGGSVCNELWAFDVSAKSWENITVRAEPCNMTSLCGPLKSAGHTATLVPSKRSVERMVVIFGHSPTFGYLNTVQEYHFGTREWSIVKTRGFPVKAGYGHSSAWDPLTERIYVYGGYISETPATPLLSNRLYAYEPETYTWSLLTSGPSARFLHTGTFLNGLMLVFGGNTHNDTSQSQGAKCYSSEVLAYDVICDSWHSVSVPNTLRADLPRFGHSAVTFSNSLYIYGGFDGQMLNDLLKYTAGICNASSQTKCLHDRPGMKCVWERKANKCVSILEVPVEIIRNPELDGDQDYYVKCPEGGRSSVTANIVACSQLSDCISCVHTSLGCGWCPQTNKCMHENVCKAQIPDTNAFTSVRAVTVAADCQVEEGSSCPTHHSCQTCTSHPDCHWTNPDHCTANTTLESPEVSVVPTCGPSCSELTSCLNCTQQECIWCHNEQRCVDKTAYTASFPYGQCREWSTQRQRCPLTPGESACQSHKWCSDCRDAPECGWCDDGTGTGKGICLPGGNQPNLEQCPSNLWHFTHCPSCQCNGHSTCANNSSVCIQPCAHLTQGEHCDTCMPGYYGSPVNGGNCTPCECNNHGTQCQPDTGRCYCTTKGIVGEHCEKCDTANHYQGDPTNNGSCFYDLTIDYQFTFNLSKKDDRHYTQINFKNSPPKADIDADFSITCSVMAKMNITMKTVNQPEKQLFMNHNCSNFKTRFYKNDYNFGAVDNVTLTTFYVYVYDFQPPLWIQISFSQYPKLNLQQFFITFSSCFLLLLLVAAILWKIKQKYDMYRRRQRLFVEMEQMASRPFSQVLVEIEKRSSSSLSTPTSPTSKKKECPSPIALEPCIGNRAAVLSLLVRMPTGGSSYTPQGQSAGLAIASALVTLGNPRKVSIDTVKGEVKGKSRKTVSSQHPDSCI